MLFLLFLVILIVVGFVVGVGETAVVLVDLLCACIFETSVDHFACSCPRWFRLKRLLKWLVVAVSNIRRTFWGDLSSVSNPASCAFSVIKVHKNFMSQYFFELFRRLPWLRPLSPLISSVDKGMVSKN
jgi:hypothetical protein